MTADLSFAVTRIGSLFSGGGGLDLAVEAVFGGATVWHAEVDPAASRVLAARWPGVPNLGDVTAVDWSSVEPVDVICGGYPCQPDSLAGKGLSEDDERWLWPEVARAIGVLRPRVVVLENVPGHFVRGFRTVLGSLASLGFDADWTLVRASDVGAPHRRERLFVVAWDAAHGRWGDSRSTVRSGERESASGGPDFDAADAYVSGSQGAEPAAGPDVPARGASADATRYGRDERRTEPARLIGGPDAAIGGDAPIEWGQYEPAIRRWERVLGRLAPAPTVPATRGGQRLNPKLPEWMMGWPDGWVTGVPGVSRNDALKICGNGVVPLQAVAAIRSLVAVGAVGVAS